MPPRNNAVYPQPVQSQQQQQTVASDRVWVNGKEGGWNYLVAKNTEQTLWDFDAPFIYIKTVDAFGRPSMVTLEYTIKEEEKELSTKDEIAELKNQFKELQNDLRNFMNQSNQQKQQYKTNYRKENNND